MFSPRPRLSATTLSLAVRFCTTPFARSLAMSHLLDTPRRPRSTESRAVKKAKLSHTATALQRAGFDYVLIRIIHDQPPTFSLRMIQRVLRDAIRAGTYTLTTGVTLAIPTSTLLGPNDSVDDPATLDRVTPSHTWVGEKRAIPPTTLTVNGLLHKARTGRPPAELDATLLQLLKHYAQRNGTMSDRMLVRYVQTAADARHLPRPSPARILRALKDIPALTRAVARHGARGGIADAATKSALPIERPYQMSVFDELQLPVWVRVWHAELRDYVCMKVPMCLVADVDSQVITGYAITNPRARGKVKSMDSLDVAGAVLSSIIPALAPEECRPYVGFLPELIGCDNITTHDLVVERLRAIGVPVTQHRAYSPWAHGPRETIVGIIKQLCEPLLGYDGRWQVAERLTKDPTSARRELSGTTMRQSPLANVAIDQLMDVATLRHAMRDVVRTYNAEILHSRWGETREARFYERRRTGHLRSWTDAIGMLDAHRVAVREHLTVRGVGFAPVSDIGHAFAQGDVVTVHVDPLLRAAFVPGETPASWGALLPAKEFAKHVIPSEYVQERAQEAHAASDSVRREREAAQAEALGGPAEAARANAIAAKKTAPKRKKAEKKRVPAGQLEFPMTPAEILIAPRMAPAAAVVTPAQPAPGRSKPRDKPVVPAPPPLLTVVHGALTAAPRSAAGPPALRGLARRSSTSLLLTTPPRPTPPHTPQPTRESLTTTPKATRKA